MTRNPLRAAAIGIGLALFAAAPATQAAVDLPQVNAAANWQASLDGVTWYSSAVYSGYPNPITAPDGHSGEAVEPRLMWFWGEEGYTGTPTGANGPSHVYFRTTFLPLAVGWPAWLWVASDDRLTIKIDNQPLQILLDPASNRYGDTYVLTDNQDARGQPIARQTADFSALLMAGGPLTIEIEAWDSGGYEWLFVDGYRHTAAAPAFVAPVSEPPLALLGAAGLAALLGLRRRVR